jgi:2-dehydro-3-deoxyphosphogluconate aldolase/(4S)-4-hydroxy-2-oxoglutarate aldolase
MTERAVMLMLGFDLKHVGMNCETEQESMSNASLISQLFSLPVKEGNSSNFVGTQFEVMKKNYLGAHGHLAIGTNFIERAIAYYERKGYSFRKETNVEKNGKRVAIYFEQEIAGFAIHLLQG